MELSISEENYLKAIYSHTYNEVWVTTNTIADAITIKASSVTDMFKKLKKKKLIFYKPYVGCKLTGDGETIALQIIRKHRLWETFLCNTLGFSWDEVHEIAEELEHIGHPELINRIDAHLGFPKTDPHGDVIPSEQGKIPIFDLAPLTSCDINATSIIRAVQSHEKGVLEILNHYSIELNTKLKITQKFAFDDSMEICINGGEKCVLPFKLAQKILVDKI